MAMRNRLNLFSAKMSTIRAKAAQCSAICVSFLAAAGCIARGSRSYPLYPPSDPPPPLEQLARLTGYVQFVDGQDVASHGNSFELLPGCHVIGTPKTWGAGHTEFGGWTWDTGRRDFVLPMKPGYFYSVEVLPKSQGGQTGSASLRAFEKDAAGNTTGTFRAVYNAPTNCAAGS